MDFKFVRGRWKQPEIYINLFSKMKKDPKEGDLHNDSLMFYSDWTTEDYPNVISIEGEVDEKNIIKMLSHEYTHWAEVYNLSVKKQDKLNTTDVDDYIKNIINSEYLAMYSANERITKSALRESVFSYLSPIINTAFNESFDKLFPKTKKKRRST